MSTIRSRFLKDKVTIWKPNTYDASSPYSDGYASPITLSCNYIDGGRAVRTAEGDTFTPSKTIRIKSYPVELDDMIAIGTYTSTEPPADAERVGGLKGGTTLVGTADFTFYTR